MISPSLGHTLCSDVRYITTSLGPPWAGRETRAAAAAAAVRSGSVSTRTKDKVPTPGGAVGSFEVSSGEWLLILMS